MEILGGVILLVFLCSAVYCQRRKEITLWNGGFNQITGLPWLQFDTDSQGGNMYSDDAGYYCTISYGVDK